MPLEPMPRRWVRLNKGKVFSRERLGVGLSTTCKEARKTERSVTNKFLLALVKPNICF